MTPDDAARLVADNPEAVEAANEAYSDDKTMEQVLVAFLAALPDPQPADATTTHAADCLSRLPDFDERDCSCRVAAPATESDA